MLGVVKFELPVEKRMKLGFNRRLPRDISESDENPCDRRGKGDQCDQKQAATVVHSQQTRKDEADSARGAPDVAADRDPKGDAARERKGREKGQGGTDR